MALSCPRAAPTCGSSNSVVSCSRNSMRPPRNRSASRAASSALSPSAALSCASCSRMACKMLVVAEHDIAGGCAANRTIALPQQELTLSTVVAVAALRGGAHDQPRLGERRRDGSAGGRQLPVVVRVCLISGREGSGRVLLPTRAVAGAAGAHLSGFGARERGEILRQLMAAKLAVAVISPQLLPAMRTDGHRALPPYGAVVWCRGAFTRAIVSLARPR